MWLQDEMFFLLRSAYMMLLPRQSTYQIDKLRLAQCSNEVGSCIQRGTLLCIIGRRFPRSTVITCA